MSLLSTQKIGDVITCPFFFCCVSFHKIEEKPVFPGFGSSPFYCSNSRSHPDRESRTSISQYAHGIPIKCSFSARSNPEVLRQINYQSAFLTLPKGNRTLLVGGQRCSPSDYYQRLKLSFFKRECTRDVVVALRTVFRFQIVSALFRCVPVPSSLPKTVAPGPIAEVPTW